VQTREKKKERIKRDPEHTTPINVEENYKFILNLVSILKKNK